MAENISGKIAIFSSSCKRTSSTHGGARKGSGGSKGKRLKVLDRKEKQQVLDRITRMLTSCMKPQFRLATGMQLLFVIKTDRKGNPFAGRSSH